MHFSKRVQEEAQSVEWAEEEKDQVNELYMLISKNIGWLFILSFACGFMASFALLADVVYVRYGALIGSAMLLFIIRARIMPAMRLDVVRWLIKWFGKKAR